MKTEERKVVRYVYRKDRTWLEDYPMTALGLILMDGKTYVSVNNLLAALDIKYTQFNFTIPFESDEAFIINKEDSCDLGVRNVDITGSKFVSFNYVLNEFSKLAYKITNNETRVTVIFNILKAKEKEIMNNITNFGNPKACDIIVYKKEETKSMNNLKRNKLKYNLEKNDISKSCDISTDLIRNFAGDKKYIRTIEYNNEIYMALIDIKPILSMSNYDYRKLSNNNFIVHVDTFDVRNLNFYNTYASRGLNFIPKSVVTDYINKTNIDANKKEDLICFFNDFTNMSNEIVTETPKEKEKTRRKRRKTTTNTELLTTAPKIYKVYDGKLKAYHNKDAVRAFNYNDDVYYCFTDIYKALNITSSKSDLYNKLFNTFTSVKLDVKLCHYEPDITIRSTKYISRTDLITYVKGSTFTEKHKKVLLDFFNIPIEDTNNYMETNTTQDKVKEDITPTATTNPEESINTTNNSDNVLESLNNLLTGTNKEFLGTCEARYKVLKKVCDLYGEILDLYRELV